MRTPVICAVLAAAALSVRASARDVWVVRGLVRVEPPQCTEALVWNADAVLHNLTAGSLTARVVDTSHGAPHGDTIAVAPGRSSALSRLLDRPDAALAAMWITRLDVPEGMRVEGRLEFLMDDCGELRPPNDIAAGAVALPVFERLALPNEAQTHFGTDLGAQPARYNVGIYNGGNTSATATIEVTRPACTADAKVRRSLSVPPGTLIQETLFDVGTACTTPPIDGTVGQWVTYTTVTVDQPSLSYVVALSGSGRPQATLGFGTK